MTLISACRSARVALLLAAVAPASLAAQERLVGAWSASTGAFFENWAFPTAIATTTASGGSALVSGASQLTIPVAAIVPIRNGWTLDVYTAWVKGEVRLATPDASGRTGYALSGATDTKLRVVGPLVGDALLLTAGVTAPTGATGLSGEQLDALGVISAPGLRFRSPVLGAGAGATVGLIFAREVAGWGLALGSSYEARGSYAPAEAFQAGTPETDLDPGNAAHMSLAGERTMGAVRHMLSVAGDVYQSGELRDPSGAVANSTLQLGPSLSGTYEIGGAVGPFEAGAFVVARRRAAYRLGGVEVEGSARTEIDGGAQAQRALSPTLALRLGVEARSHSVGTTSDVTGGVGFATAGISAAGGTVALRFTRGGGSFVFEPFVRAQVGQLDFRSQQNTVTGLSGGTTITARF